MSSSDMRRLVILNQRTLAISASGFIWKLRLGSRSWVPSCRQSGPDCAVDPSPTLHPMVKALNYSHSLIHLWLVSLKAPHGNRDLIIGNVFDAGPIYWKIVEKCSKYNRDGQAHTHKISKMKCLMAKTLHDWHLEMFVIFFFQNFLAKIANEVA